MKSPKKTTSPYRFEIRWWASRTFDIVLTDIWFFGSILIVDFRLGWASLPAGIRAHCFLDLGVDNPQPLYLQYLCGYAFQNKAPKRINIFSYLSMVDLLAHPCLQLAFEFLCAKFSVALLSLRALVDHYVWSEYWKAGRYCSWSQGIPYPLIESSFHKKCLFFIGFVWDHCFDSMHGWCLFNRRPRKMGLPVSLP